MHGIGNDYIYLDAVGSPELDKRKDLPALARAMSNRHKGIGSDGLILVCLPTPEGANAGAHVRMRMFNADGSESAMCGNGIRCVAKFAHDRLGFTDPTLRVETGSGTLSITHTLDANARLATATVDMGEPVFELEPAGLRALEAKANTPRKPVTVHIDDFKLQAIIVGTGNPHAVFFLEPDGNGPNDHLGPKSNLPDGTRRLELQSLELSKWGPRIAHHAMFKNFTNVHFAAVKGKKTVHMRTWERGSGITQACGTGACAVVAAGVVTGRLARDVNATLPGGTLNIRWDESTNHLFMTGPAEEICTGTWPIADPPPLASIPTLTTERLTLRPFTHADARAVATLAGDKRISDMTLTVPHPYKPEHATAWISTHALGHTLNLNTVWAMTLTGSGEVIGAVGIVYNKHNSAEIGYWLGVTFWSKGYTTEASQAVIRYAFDQRTPPLQRVDAHHFFGNQASGRVMQKSGMTCEGDCLAAARKADGPLNVTRYAITRDQWLDSSAHATHHAAGKKQ